MHIFNSSTASIATSNETLEQKFYWPQKVAVKLGSSGISALSVIRKNDTTGELVEESEVRKGPSPMSWFKKLSFGCLALVLTAISAHATSYHEVIVSGVAYHTAVSNGGESKNSINNKYLIQKFVQAITKADLAKYAVVVDDSTGNVEVIERATGTVEGTVFASSDFTAKSWYANETKHFLYETRNLTWMYVGSATGTGFYQLTQDASTGDYLPTRIDFVVGQTSFDDYGTPIKGAIVVTKKTITFN
jgi:hypothetical protein